MSDFGDLDEKRAMQEATKKAKNDAKNTVRKVVISQAMAAAIALGKVFLFGFIASTIVFSIVNFLNGGDRRRKGICK